MPSTYTTNLSLEKQATGENDNTWGIKWNTLVDTLDSVICRRYTKALSDADATLTASETLYAILLFTGSLTASRTITLPASQFWKFVDNQTNYPLIFTTASASNTVTVPPKRQAKIYCDGTDILALEDSPRLKGEYHPVTTVASSGATETIDASAGSVYDITLDAACTISLTNPASSGFMTTLTVILRQDGTGGRLVTWPAAVKWAGGVAPTLSTAASAKDVLILSTTDGGTTWDGVVAGIGMA